MRFTKTFIAAAIGAATLGACTEDLTEMEASGNVLQVSTNVNATTKAIVEGQLGANQKIGISLLATDGSDYNGKTEGYKNVLYNSELLTMGGVKWTSEKPIILSPATGTAYAYYPYSADVSDIKAIPVETASQTDYMYADPVEGLSSSNSKANFSLNHALCAVQINVKNDSYTQGPGNISRIEVSSAELATAASLNSMTGELSAFSGKGGEIVDTNAFTIGKEAHATTLMAVPTGGQGELTIKVTLDGKNHRVKMPIQTPFVKGKRYVLDILAKDKTAPLEIVSVNVKPWMDENLGDYDVIPELDNKYIIQVNIPSQNREFDFYSNVRGFTGTIDWGDGTITMHTNEDNPSHKYNTGTYTIIHKGECPRLTYDVYEFLASARCLIDIIHIGSQIGLISFERAFNNCQSLKTLKSEIFHGLSAVTSFESTFENCSSLIDIPVGLFDKCPNVTNFYRTFWHCWALTTIPAGLFDNCTQVINFNGTFSGTNITAIPQGLFDNCTNVSNFQGTFYGCKKITAIPAGLFNHNTQVTSFYETFRGCYALTTIPNGLFDNCPNVTNFGSTFYECSKITTIPPGLFDRCTKVTNFQNTFFGCVALTTIPNGLFDKCPNVERFGSTFARCRKLKAIPAGLFDKCTQAWSFNQTFWGCETLTSIPQGLFDYNMKATNFDYTFAMCTALNSIPEGLFNNCIEIGWFHGTFENCSSLTAIPQDVFKNCTKVVRFTNTFFRCSSLTDIPQGLFDDCTKVTGFQNTFSGCKALTGESPYTLINGQKVHLYERVNYPEYFTAPTSTALSFYNCTGLTDYNEIPADWK